MFTIREITGEPGNETAGLPLGPMTKEAAVFNAVARTGGELRQIAGQVDQLTRGARVRVQVPAELVGRVGGLQDCFVEWLAPGSFAEGAEVVGPDEWNRSEREAALDRFRGEHGNGDGDW